MARLNTPIACAAASPQAWRQLTVVPASSSRLAAGPGAGAGGEGGAVVVNGTRTAIALVVTVITGCGAVDPTPRWRQVEQLSSDATRQPLVWERDDADTERIRR